MKVVYGIGNLAKDKRRRRVIAVGVFDGVHRGHQKILACVVRQARRRGLESAVVTFAQHPSHFFHHDRRIPALTSLEHKLKLIEDAGIDTCFVLSFDEKLAGMAPQYFVERVLVEKLGLFSLYVGEDFVFGYGGRGDIHLLRKLAKRSDFNVHVLKHLKLHNRIVSSTLIRSLIKKGNLDLASIFLGRRVSFLGDVIKGEGRGKTLGFPTANIRPHHEILAPDGIYASEAFCGRRRFNSLTYLGTKPTFNKLSEDRSIEVYLLGLCKDLYGQKMEVRLIKKIRNDKKFTSAGALVAQMKNDVVSAKKIFASSKISFA
ncbi:MAG: riboflavin biosynthesis protein RibF [Candidatus Omnitrophica bacterium]|nr:riboflavin biosynthesis protein RibF [Candidatus Omnitrophota bacterium]